MTSPDDPQQTRIEAAVDELLTTHWDGTGCGTNGVNACSRCCGPSPADVREVVEQVLAAADRVDPPLSRVIALAESEQALGEESYFAEEIGDVIAFLENARLHYAEGGS